MANQLANIGARAQFRIQNRKRGLSRFRKSRKRFCNSITWKQEILDFRFYWSLKHSLLTYWSNILRNCLFNQRCSRVSSFGLACRKSSEFRPAQPKWGVNCVLLGGFHIGEHLLKKFWKPNLNGEKVAGASNSHNWICFFLIGWKGESNQYIFWEKNALCLFDKFTILTF